MQDKLDIQRKKLLDGNPEIKLVDSCRIGNGIIALSEAEKAELIDTFEAEKSDLDICFFTPASGSGSRMFSVLFEFLDEPNADNTNACKKLANHIEKMALFNLFSEEWKAKIKNKSFELDDFIQYLLSEGGLNISSLPKGLIPFHLYESTFTNPFQEHLLQGAEISGTKAFFHFTIDADFQDEIIEPIKALEKAEGKSFAYGFSVQDPKTNSIAFDDNYQAAKDENGLLITRPSGHGALIKNLDQIDADIIFIRNIDNMQHHDKADPSIRNRKMLAAALLNFQEDVHNILKKVNRGNAFASSVAAFNDKYDMRIPKELFADESFVYNFFNRPLRVCGMVKNDGAPGGGPFWVEENGNVVRQIVEKSQISSNKDQIELMETATHFNPVELVCAVRNFEGHKFELREFVNPNQYFIVNKTQEGQSIQYIEQPGLWNGGMANWLTLFYEIDSECFSPVKTVLDLLSPAHIA